MAISKQQIDDNSLTIFTKVSEFINQQILTSGKLQKNNKEIWSTLHQMDNDIWGMYCHGIRLIEQEFPHCVDMNTLKSVMDCEKIIDRYGHLSRPEQMDTTTGARLGDWCYKVEKLGILLWALICQMMTHQNLHLKMNCLI